MILTEQNVRDAIGSVISDVDVTSIDASTDFYEYDLDSLHHAHIILRIEELYGLRIADEDFEDCCSINGIIEYTQRWQNSSADDGDTSPLE